VKVQHLTQAPPADLHIPILGQLAPGQLPVGNPLEPGSLEIVSLDAPLGVGGSGGRALEHAPRDPDHFIGKPLTTSPRCSSEPRGR
jgi:hypothetical protein